MFVFHGPTPVGISKGVPDGPWQRGQSLGVQGEARLPVAGFPTSRHVVGVIDRRDGNSACRNRRVSLHITRWRRNNARASRRGARRGRRRQCRGGSTLGVDMDDGWLGEAESRGCLRRGRHQARRGHLGASHGRLGRRRRRWRRHRGRRRRRGRRRYRGRCLKGRPRCKPRRRRPGSWQGANKSGSACRKRGHWKCVVIS
jgi:hypothetical protein